MSNRRVIRIGTRKSALARAQTEMVARVLRSSNPAREISVDTFTTNGDRKRSLSGVARDKRDWISDIEEALVTDQISLAVHSGKDVPIEIAEGTAILPVLSREEPRDIFIPRDPDSSWLSQSEPILDGLALGARIGTASLRRGAQLKNWRKDLEVVELRGNVPTRLSRLQDDPSLSGIVLAAAGLIRLDLRDIVCVHLPLSGFIPAVNQGILNVQFATEKQDIRSCVEQLVVPEVYSCWSAERSFIAGIGADCHSAVGVVAEVFGHELCIQAQVLAPDGDECLSAKRVGAAEQASDLGRELADCMLAQGAEKLLKRAT